MNDSASSNFSPERFSGENHAAGEQPALPAWMERLFDIHAPALPVKRRRWFARDIYRFLKYCRARGADRLDLPLLAEEWVETLRHSEPPMEVWQVEQARQSVEVFERGVNGWRWEKMEGEWRPRFRLLGDAVSQTAPEEAAVESLDAGGGGSARERMRRALRVRHYSLRTEQTYLQWVDRFQGFHAAGEAPVPGSEAVRSFLEDLALRRNVSASTQNQAG